MADFLFNKTSPAGSLPGETLERIRLESRERTVAALLRHAAREDIIDAHSALDALLTPEGRAGARAFGAGLPLDRLVRIFHSPVERCKETAIHMAEGFREAGGRTGGVHESNILGGPYVLDPDALLELLAGMDPPTFMEAWSGGGIAGTVLRPLRDTAVQTLQFVLSMLENAPQSSVDLHVTHDINIMIVLALAGDLASNWSQWPAYLEGLLLSVQGEDVTLRFRERRAAIKRKILMPRPPG